MFIQIIQGSSSRTDEIRALTDEWERAYGGSVDGWLGSTYGATDDGVFVGVVRFDSRGAAQANSDSPAQGEWWARMEPLFDGQVEFRDYDDVTTILDGGSDDAGFVQVSHGRAGNPDVFRTLVAGADMLREMRPEIIGATVGIAADGGYTQTTAFTDEESARKGEQLEMPGEVKEQFAAADIRDESYLDLHRPWFASKG